ncbi:MAG: TonB-dependent receptor [Bacteroidota bacterium]
MIPRVALLALLLASVPASAQPAERVDLVLRGVPAREALATLAEAARMDLVYTSDLVRNARVWCGGENAAPEAVLGCITRAVGLDFVRRSSGTYVLVERVEREPAKGSLAGRVVDAETGEPLPYAHVVLRDARAGAATDLSGAFLVAGVVPGPQTVTASYVGYTPTTQTVRIAPGGRAVREIALQREEVEAAPVVVDGIQARPISSRLGAGEWEPTLESVPGAASAPDALRSATAVLGVAPPNFRDGLSIQGGETGEHLLRLDGATVYEPVALGTALSAMSPLALGRVTVRKAGFGARHGSSLAGLLDAEHVIPAPGVIAEANALASTFGGSIRQQAGETRIAAAVTARRHLWDVNRPNALDGALREWNTVDPVLAASLAGTPEVPAFDAHRHGSDVAFSDLHGAARVQFGPLRTLRVSAYRGASEIGTELFAAGQNLTDPSALVLTRDRYRWTNTAASARYSWLAGPRVLLGASLTASRHTLTHAFEQADGGLAGLTGNETTARAEAALVSVLDAHNAGDDGNALSEVRLATTAEISIAPGHTAYIALEATGLDSRFHLNSNGPTAVGLRDLDADAQLWRLALALDDEIAIGRGWTAEPGLRVTLLPDGATLAEPRAALRYDTEAGRLGTLSARLAGGIYRQFAVRYDLATVGPSALVPEMAVWVPTDGVAAPRATHVAAEALWKPAENWSVRAEGYVKAQNSLRVLDYAALLNAAPDPLTRQADWTKEGEGRAAGLGLRVERRGSRVSLAAGYAFGLTERRFDGRFDGVWQPTAWEEPHAVTLAASWAVLGSADSEGLTFRARGRGVWGRTWAFRRAYYEVLAAHDGATSFAPFDLSRPGSDALPAWIDLDLGLTLRQRVGGANLEVAAEVTNALDRANALDWWLRQAETGYEAVTRSSPGIQPALRVRLGL